MKNPQRSVDNAGAPAAAGQVHRVDTERLGRMGFVEIGGTRTRVSEEYRILKRPLLINAFAPEDERDYHANLIMITSSRPNEGKTYTALCMAMSMASEKDINVVLVDADLHKQRNRTSSMAVLGVAEEQTGLIDVLSDPNLDLSDALLRTNIPNLTLLPAGKMVNDPTELFASNRMGQVIGELARRYPDRVILFDTPPLLATSEPSVLAMHVGQIVVVVEAETTTRETLEASLALLNRSDGVSLVLNKARLRASESSFGYYSYY